MRTIYEEAPTPKHAADHGAKLANAWRITNTALLVLILAAVAMLAVLVRHDHSCDAAYLSEIMADVDALKEVQ